LFLLAFGLVTTSRSAFGANTPPTIQKVPDQTVFIDHPTVALQLGLEDAETTILSLRLTGSSSDERIVPRQNIFFGTAVGHWYTTVTPAFGATGTATITVTVSDGEFSASTNFVITVNPPPQSTTRFVSAPSISIPQLGAATPYPSLVGVAGLTGVISSVSLVLNGFNHDNIRDVNMLLVSPTGQGIVLFSHVSGNRHCTNVTVFLTDNSTYPLPTEFDLWSEPLRPTDLSPDDNFPGAPPGPYRPPAFSSFRGLEPNGNWSLYIYDDKDTNGGSITGGWSMLITTVAAPTITPIADQTTTPGTGLPPIPFTVGDADTAFSALQLTRQSSDPTIVRVENIVLSGNAAERAVTITPLPGAFGTTRITLTVSDDLASASSSFFLTVTQASSGILSFANPQVISIPALGRASPYPSTIEVSRAKGTIGKLSVIINSMDHTYPADVDMLLVGPQGQRTVIFSDAGKGAFAITGTTIMLEDDASDYLPEIGRLSPGTFRPTNYEPGESGDYDSWPDAPEGSTNSVLSVYEGLSPNGIWSLYIVDDGPGDVGALNGGWRLLMDIVPGPADVVLTSIVRLENGSMRLRGTAEPGLTYLIQISSDLEAWDDLGTTRADETGVIELDDTPAQDQTTRFYRAITAPSQ